MENLIKEEIIFNSLHNFAILYQVKKGFEMKIFLEKAKSDYPKLRFRVYFWIDDDIASLNDKIISKFENLFKITGLQCSKFNNGNPFSINSLKFKIEENNIEKAILKPREGQDGGVLGITC